MSDFNWEHALGIAERHKPVSIYICARFVVLESDILRDAAKAAGVDLCEQACDCELEAVVCECPEQASAWYAHELLTPKMARWSSYGADREGVIELAFEMPGEDPFGRLVDVDPSDRDHWRARLCAYALDYFFDHSPEFYRSLGLELASFDASDSLGELSSFYA